MGGKNAFLVRVILQAEGMEAMEWIIRKAVREELKCGSPAQSKPESKKEGIPKPMLDFLDSL